MFTTMKKNLQKITGMLLVVGLSVPAVSQATGPRVTANLLNEGMQIYAQDFPPFISTSVAGGGFDAEIVHAVMRTVELDAQVTSLPLKRMVEYYLMQENAVAVLARNMTFSAQQKANLIFVPISVIQEQFYYYQPAQPKGLTWNGDLQQLSGLTYGAHKGEEVSAFKSAGLTVSYGKSRTLLKKLKSDKVDLVKFPQLTAQWLLAKYHPKEAENYVAMKPAVGVQPTFIVFNKKHPEGERVANQFKSGLEALIKQGGYQKIAEKHLGSVQKATLHLEALQAFR